ncbi:enoyl-CoA hydratase [Bacillus carboniphilus]|uniref:Enoyl-CoA hydratase n=1 Tax=Bacillus carboniphilus TaxID=86663 RepID=A0ABY9JZZ2_9BACI|nr:enoyl-CoA hydratase [Bacillus carboniphilus]WLR44132.1 enoyl-CoA hydratase [Bacillus carboniphilus]
MNNLTCSIESRIATVEIQHPPANALSSFVLKELSSLLDELETNDQVRVIVLRGEGKFFSAGADIKEFTTVQSGEEFADLGKNGQELFSKVERFSKPIIAVIHGAALGGGLELAMACHMRIVAKKAKLGLPELQLGIIPGFAGTQRLPRYVGDAKALEMMLTSEPISGEEAYKWGLANHCVEEEELLSKAQELAVKIATKSPISVKGVVDLVNYQYNHFFDDSVHKEAEIFGEVFKSNDAKEGISAFIEKRKPSFQGE